MQMKKKVLAKKFWRTILKKQNVECISNTTAVANIPSSMLTQTKPLQHEEKYLRIFPKKMTAQTTRSFPRKQSHRLEARPALTHPAAYHIRILRDVTPRRHFDTVTSYTPVHWPDTIAPSVKDV